MGNIPEIYLLQSTKKNLEQAKRFQDEMGNHFFEHTMYDIKDALTSILALCDMEDMKQTPQVKAYIKRVSDLLNDVKLYQSSYLFNVNHVVINVINVLKDHYKARISISHDLTYIKAYAESDKSHLEQILLYWLIEAIQASQEEPLKVRMELSQKDRNALISIKFENFLFSDVAIREIFQFYGGKAFKMVHNKVDSSAEVIFRVPLSFDIKDPQEAVAEKRIHVTMGELKPTEVRV